MQTILMMAGSFGVTNVFDVYENIIDIDLDFQIILVTGRNQKLYNHFEKVIDDSPKKTKLYILLMKSISICRPLI